jgi:hypothetical protein
MADKVERNLIFNPGHKIFIALQAPAPLQRAYFPLSLSITDFPSLLRHPATAVRPN